MKINMRNWIENIIADKAVHALPIMTHPGIELNGKTVHKAVSDGTTHYEAVMRLAEMFPSAAAPTIMDLTVEAECFGAQIVFSDEAVPAVVGRRLNNAADITKLAVPSLSSGRIPQYLKANVLCARQLTDRPLLAGCIGPFSLAGRLYDMSDIMVLICEEPNAAHELLYKCTAFILKYVTALKETGANGVIMAEPAAGLLSNDDCLNFSSLYVRHIVRQVQDDFFSVVLHNCGDTGHCTQASVASEAAMFHFGNKCDMLDVVRHVPKTALAMGNLDPVSVFKGVTPEQMRTKVTALLNRMKDHSNFVLSSGCDTPPHTSMANINAFFSALNDWNAQNS